MKALNILVTGGSGFIGRPLVAHLRGRGANVTAADNRSLYGVLFCPCDVTQRQQVFSLVEGQDFVLHLAGRLGTHELNDDAAAATHVNICGTLNVLDACVKYGARLIFASKPNVWLNTYSITKEACERFIALYRKERGLRAVVCKWFNVYGPGQPTECELGYRKAVPTWATEDTVEVYGSGEQTMDLVHVDDAVRAIALIVKRFGAVEGRTFEVGSGRPTSANSLAAAIAHMTGAKVVHLPMRKGETENTELVANIALAREMLDWEPEVPLDRGLRETVEWYRKRKL